MMLSQIVLHILPLITQAGQLDNKITELRSLPVDGLVQPELFAQEMEGLDYGKFGRLHVLEYL